MPDRIEFETPENVLVSYQLAGLGSRWLAWFVDQILLAVLLLVILIVLAIVGLGLGGLFDDLLGLFPGAQPGGLENPGLYVIGLFILLYGLSNFLYFGLSEYLMRGQTIGKRNVSVRVVKADGFALDAGSILIRSLFRVVDHMPALWIVPFVSKDSQRLGDMVAGTIVVADQPAQIGVLRESLLNRPDEEIVFRFDHATLKRARPADVEAAERIVERVAELPMAEREDLLETICVALAERLEREPPPPDQYQTFLTDFLTAEFRRQQRELG